VLCELVLKFRREWVDSVYKLSPLLRSESVSFKHGVRDEVVAELVDGNDKVIVVSLEKVVVDSVVEVSHVHH